MSLPSYKPTPIWLRFGVGLLLAGVVSLAVILAAAPRGPRKRGVFEQAELAAYDAATRSLPGPTPLSDILIVGVDRASLKRLGVSLDDVPRSEYAAAIERLYDAGAYLICADVAFYQERSSAEDAELERVLNGEPGGATILACEIAGGRLRLPPAKFCDMTAGTGALGVGAVNIPQTADTVVRSIPLAVRDLGGNIVYSLAAVVASYYLQDLCGEESPSIAAGEFVCGKLRAPLDMLIRFPGPSPAYRRLPFWRVLEGRFDPDVVVDKVVFIGSTVPFRDAFATPLSMRAANGVLSQTSGVEIHASAFQTLAEQHFTRRIEWPRARLILAGVGLLAAFLLTGFSFSAPVRTALWVGTAGAYAAWWYRQLGSGCWYDFATVETLLGVNFVVGALYNFILLARRNRKLKGLFGRYVSPDVMRKILADPAAVAKPERKEVAVLISDLRSFTAMSESMAPEDVLALLNEYLSAMLPHIFEHHGTVDKFVGDEIMVVFGAPFEVPHAPDEAVATAVLMQQALTRFNAHQEGTGRPAIHMGIGIHYGPVVSGNIGAAERVEYTSIGDTVNTSARVEGQTGAGDVFITDAVRLGLKEDYDLAELPPVELKGKSEPVRIFRVEYPHAT